MIRIHAIQGLHISTYIGFCKFFVLFLSLVNKALHKNYINVTLILSYQEIAKSTNGITLNSKYSAQQKKQQNGKTTYRMGDKIFQTYIG